MATKKKATKTPSQSEMDNNQRKAAALKKIVEHNRDYLKVDITLPLGDMALKQVHTNQWLFTDLPKEFDFVNWTIIAEALNSNVNRFEGYVKNRWYIDTCTIDVDASGKAEMKLGLNAFASSYNSYSDMFKSFEKAYNDAVNKKNTTTNTTSAAKKTTNAVTNSSTGLINQEWVKKYSIPSIVVEKVKVACKEGASVEDNVYAWHKWMDNHVDYWSYTEHQYSMEQVLNQGGGNCVDNSRVFRAGCLAMGVKCTFIKASSCCCTSYGDVGHQYNKVYLPGKTVIVDNGRGDASWGSHWGDCSGIYETETSW